MAPRLDTTCSLFLPQEGQGQVPSLGSLQFTRQDLGLQCTYKTFHDRSKQQVELSKYEKVQILCHEDSEEVIANGLRNPISIKECTHSFYI